MYILRPMKNNNGKLANIVVSYINLGSYFYPVLCGALGGAWQNNVLTSLYELFYITGLGAKKISHKKFILASPLSNLIY